MDDHEVLKAALQAGDFPAVRDALLAGAIVDGECWEWPLIGHRGYPNLGTKWFGLHRLVLNCKGGGKAVLNDKGRYMADRLGKDHAHHACGNRVCVNPDHLLPASVRENVGEMQQRSYYVAVEARLRELAPDDPVLNRLD